MDILKLIARMELKSLKLSTLYTDDAKLLLVSKKDGVTKQISTNKQEIIDYIASANCVKGLYLLDVTSNVNIKRIKIRDFNARFNAQAKKHFDDMEQILCITN